MEDFDTAAKDTIENQTEGKYPWLMACELLETNCIFIFMPEISVPRYHNVSQITDATDSWLHINDQT